MKRLNNLVVASALAGLTLGACAGSPKNSNQPDPNAATDKAADDATQTTPDGDGIPPDGDTPDGDGDGTSTDGDGEAESDAPAGPDGEG